MERVTVTRPVAVLVKVTPGYRRAVREEIRAALAAVEREEARLNREKQARPGDGELAGRRRRLAETREGLLARARETETLADGRLVLHGRLESLVEVRVGDSWQDGVEVILEEGRVVEIRPTGGGGPWPNT